MLEKKLLPTTKIRITGRIMGTMACFGAFKIYGNNRAPMRAGAMFWNAGCKNGLLYTGAKIGARNSIPKNTIAVVTNVEAATAIIATTSAFSLPGA